MKTEMTYRLASEVAVPPSSRQGMTPRILTFMIMNVSILGVIPWRELGGTATSDARRYVISVFMQRLYGNWAGYLVTVLIIWTAFASVFSLLLGYSRIPY